jgi:hypothetical protein
MTATTFRPTYLLDDVVKDEREHEVSLIASVMELEGSGWPGEGAKADIKRLCDARRISFMRWAVEVGEINDGR